MWSTRALYDLLVRLNLGILLQGGGAKVEKKKAKAKEAKHKTAEAVSKKQKPIARVRTKWSCGPL